jgi:hypothetical protein
MAGSLGDDARLCSALVSIATVRKSRRAYIALDDLRIAIAMRRPRSVKTDVLKRERLGVGGAPSDARVRSLP